MKEFSKFLGVFIYLGLAASASAKSNLHARTADERIGVEKPPHMLATIRNPAVRNIVSSVTSPIDCYNLTGNLSTNDSAILCSGATSNAPIDCYNLTGTINTHDSAVLCSGAKSNAPIDCYNNTGSLSVHDSAVLCSGAESNDPIACYNNTGTLSARDSAILCSGI